VVDGSEDVVVGSARRGTLPSDAFDAGVGSAEPVVLVGTPGSGVGDGGVWFVPPTDPAAGADDTPVPELNGAGTGVGVGVDTGVLKCTAPTLETGAVELVAGVEKGI